MCWGRKLTLPLETINALFHMQYVVFTNHLYCGMTAVGRKIKTEVKAKATKCRSQLTTVMCCEKTMVNIAHLFASLFTFTSTFSPCSLHFKFQNISFQNNSFQKINSLTVKSSVKILKAITMCTGKIKYKS